MSYWLFVVAGADAINSTAWRTVRLVSSNAFAEEKLKTMRAFGAETASCR